MMQHSMNAVVPGYLSDHRTHRLYDEFRRHAGGSKSDKLKTQSHIFCTCSSSRISCTVNSFISLASQKYFDDTPCHRLTNAPGLFLYTANFIDTRRMMKGGLTYPLRAGVALDLPEDRHPTAAMVEDWQESIGIEPTGRVAEPGIVRHRGRRRPCRSGRCWKTPTS